MKAFVTGASSFVGSEVCKELLKDGFEVWALVRAGSPNTANLPEHRNFHVVWGGLAELENVTEGFSGFDIFFHMAWTGGGHKDWHETELQNHNVENSLHAIDTAKRIGATCFVFTGSQAEYGFMNGVTDENSPCNPVTEYGKAKLRFGREGAKKAEQAGLKFLHLRIFSVYGPKDHPWTLISTAVKKMLLNEPLQLSCCLQLWNYTYVKDAAREITLLSRYAFETDGFKYGIFHIASNDTRPLAAFVDEMLQITGSKSELRKAEPVYPLLSLQPSVEKTKNAVGFTGQYSFSDGIKEIINTL